MYAATRMLVAERLARLDAGAREIVACGALLGYRLDVAALAACAGVSLLAVLAALEQACEADLLVSEAGPPARYRFRHALTRAAVREAVAPRARRTLHAQIAARLETLEGRRHPPEQLAYHWLAAGDRAKAAGYFEFAAESARRLGADRDALRYAELARATRPGRA